MKGSTWFDTFTVATCPEVITKPEEESNNWIVSVLSKQIHNLFVYIEKYLKSPPFSLL